MLFCWWDDILCNDPGAPGAPGARDTMVAMVSVATPLGHRGTAGPPWHLLGQYSTDAPTC